MIVVWTVTTAGLVFVRTTRSIGMRVDPFLEEDGFDRSIRIADTDKAQAPRNNFLLMQPPCIIFLAAASTQDSVPLLNRGTFQLTPTLLLNVLLSTRTIITVCVRVSAVKGSLVLGAAQVACE